MSASETPFDWQHPEVVGRLTERLHAQVIGWVLAGGLGAHLPTPVAKAHLREALVYGGMSLDGYDLARFLESKRNWPANQDLVAALSQATPLREAVLRELQAPSGLWLCQMEEFPEGTLFWSHRQQFQIVGRAADVVDGKVVISHYTVKYANHSNNRLPWEIEARVAREVIKEWCANPSKHEPAKN